jgi:hypothetical protein
MDFETILVISAAWLCNTIDALNQLKTHLLELRALLTCLMCVKRSGRGRGRGGPGGAQLNHHPPSSLSNNSSSALIFTRTKTGSGHETNTMWFWFTNDDNMAVTNHFYAILLTYYTNDNANTIWFNNYRWRRHQRKAVQP